MLVTLAYPGATAWDGLAEGSVLKLGAAATQLAETAATIAREGRVGHLSRLRADADELVRRADALVTMTADEP